MSTDDDYSKVAEQIKHLAENSIVFLLPPGSNRGEVVKRLKNSGLEILIYKKLYERIRNDIADDKNIKAVEKAEDVIENIKGDKKLEETLGLGGKVIVPESTIEFLLLINEIRRGLVEEGKDKKEAEKIIENYVKVYSLLIEEKHVNLDEKTREATKVHYTSVLKDVVNKQNFIGKPEGISSKLVEKIKKNRKYVEEGVEAIRVFDPEYINPKDAYKSLKESAISSFVRDILSTFGSEIGGPILVDLIEYLTGFTVITLGKKYLRKIPKSVLEIIIKGKKKEVIESMRELFRAVSQSKDHINDDDFETVVDEVASKWGLSLEDFRNFINNLFNAIKGKFVTEEELEKRLEELEKEIEETKRIVQMVAVFPAPLIFDADSWSYVKGSNNATKLMKALFPEVNYAKTPLEDELLSELSKAIRDGKGLIVLKGEKGIGKSTAAMVVLWSILKQNVLVVEEEQGMNVYRPVIVEFGIFKVDLHQLKRFIDVAKSNGFLPIFYVDPSKIGAYDQNIYYIENFTKGLQSIIEVLKANTVLENAIVLIVLSNDQYKLVENQLKDIPLIELVADELLKEKKVKVDILSEIIKNNSSCEGDTTQSLADLISERFLDNYILVAILVADMLKKSGCKVEDVKKSIENAKGQVHKFILDYIWKGILGGDVDIARRHVPLITAIGFFGHHPPIWGEAVIRAFGAIPEDEIVNWLTQPLHGTVLETIRMIAVSAAKKAFNINNVEDICNEDSRPSCKLIKICEEHLTDIGIQRRKYNSVDEVASRYMEIVLERLIESGVLDNVIREFMGQLGGEEINGVWKINEGGKETYYNKADALLIMSYFSLLSLTPFWEKPSLYMFIQPNKLEHFFVNHPIIELWKKHNNIVTLLENIYEQAYILYPYILKSITFQSAEEIINETKRILKDIEGKRYVTELDFFRGISILQEILRLSDITDEKFIIDLSKLSALLANASFPLSTDFARALLIYEVWDRIKRRWKNDEIVKSITDYVNMVIHNPRDPKRILRVYFELLALLDQNTITTNQGSYSSYNFDTKTIFQYFNMLYNYSSKIGKLALLDKLFYLNSEEALYYLSEQDSEKLCDKIKERVDELLEEFNDGEKNIAKLLLYSGLARCYAKKGDLNRVDEYAKEACEIAKEDISKDYDKLRDYLEVWFLRPNLSQELDLLRQVMYRRLSQAYLMIGDIKRAQEFAKEACEIAKNSGEVKDILRSCGLFYSINNITREQNIEKFKELYEMVEEKELSDKISNRIKTQYIISLSCKEDFSNVSKLIQGLPEDSMIRNEPLILLIEKQLFSNIEMRAKYSSENLISLFQKAFENLDKEFQEKIILSLNIVLREELQTVNSLEELERKFQLFREDSLNENTDYLISKINLSDEEIFNLILLELSYCRHRGESQNCKKAESLAKISSQKFKGIEAQLFSELTKAIVNGDWKAVICEARRLYLLITAYYFL